MGEQKENTQQPLFPLYQANPVPNLTGIARLAADSETTESGHLVEFRTLKVRSILNKSVSKRQHYFSHSINPYRGCEFACRYCYARYTHEFMELRDPELFERRIFIKQNAAWLLRQELRRVRPGEEIAIGTATDPYQPIERRALVTRSILEVLAGQSGLRIGIITKSTLIERDIPLLQRLAARNQLTLHLTITTPSTELARILEPRAPRPDLRFQTVQRLRQAGLRTGILCCPLLPGITDTPSALDAMVSRAREANASFFAAQPLFLKPCSRETFLRFIREYFPELEASYHKRYDVEAFVSKAYRKRMADLVYAATRKHGLVRRNADVLLGRTAGAQQASCGMQQCLWQEGGSPNGAQQSA